MKSDIIDSENYLINSTNYFKDENDSEKNYYSRLSVNNEWDCKRNI